MKNKLMVSVAALALFACGGMASAQTTREAPAPSAAPSGSSGGQMNGGATQRGASEMKGTTGQAPSAADRSQGAAEKAPDHDATSPRALDRRAPSDNRRGANDQHHRGTTGQSSDRNRSDVKSQNERGGAAKTGQNAGETSGGSDVKSRSESRSGTTTGQGAAATRGSVNLSSEQRTKITSTIRSRSTEFRPVTHVNFSISVGTRVPRSGVTLYTLPTEVVEVYPAWRGYKFILVNDEIVVVDPNTFEIVAVIEA